MKLHEPAGNDTISFPKLLGPDIGFDQSDQVAGFILPPATLKGVLGLQFSELNYGSAGIYSTF